MCDAVELAGADASKIYVAEVSPEPPIDYEDLRDWATMRQWSATGALKFATGSLPHIQAVMGWDEGMCYSPSPVASPLREQLPDLTTAEEGDPAAAPVVEE